MLGATAPNTGARSSDCGSTCHSLMKAQRNGAENSGKRGAVPVLFSTTDCLRISAMSNKPSKLPHPRHPERICRQGMLTVFAETLLNEREVGFLDL
jgi:hypothetical protein